MKALSQSITGWCRRYCELNEDESDIVRYGIETTLNTSTKMVILLIVGAVLHRFSETVITLTVFGALRSFAGGYHCKTHLGCLGTMLLISLSPIAFEQLSFTWALPLWIAMMTYAVYEIVRYAPRNSEVNPIYDEGILRKKRRGSLLVCRIIVVLVILIPNNHFRWLAVLPLFAEAVTVSPMFYKKKY